MQRHFFFRMALEKCLALCQYKIAEHEPLLLENYDAA